MVVFRFLQNIRAPLLAPGKYKLALEDPAYFRYKIIMLVCLTILFHLPTLPCKKSYVVLWTTNLSSLGVSIVTIRPQLKQCKYILTHQESVISQDSMVDFVALISYLIHFHPVS